MYIKQVCRASIRFVRGKLDDALDAFSLFGVAGVTGSVATAFASALGGTQPTAVLRTQVAVQIFSCGAVATWALIATLLVAKVTKVLAGDLRVPAAVEDYGTDLMLAEDNAYSNA